ncbi:hypothetical protein N7522_007980 [Penicillium canescens]|nr:hypothetical protein N7522_007980 [Penicillium canescens]
MAEMENLYKMDGEVITTPRTKLSESYFIPERDWIILRKMDEHPTLITPEDFQEGMGPAFTAGKYYCRLAGAGNENNFAFMRIYKQIPLYGTRLDNASVRRAQASEPREHPELEAMMRFTRDRSTATPKVRGYRTGIQDANDLVPGGYIIYLVWEEVKGFCSLDRQYFWSLPYNKRQLIRERFKIAFSEVMKFGYEPILATSSKIILNKDTGDVKISGFSRAVRIDPDTKWTDHFFVIFYLVLSPFMCDKRLPNLATDLQLDEKTGWRW